MLSQLTNMGQPIIEVYDANFNGGELLLTHQFEGVALDDTYTKPTLKNLYAIWKRPVHLFTYRTEKGREDAKSILISYNGSSHEEKPFDLQ
jgi:stage V sporulation protein R